MIRAIIAGMIFLVILGGGYFATNGFTGSSPPKATQQKAGERVRPRPVQRVRPKAPNRDEENAIEGLKLR